MHISNTDISCGVLQVSGLNDNPKEECKELGKYLFYGDFDGDDWSSAAFFIWSDTTKSSLGRKLGEFITNNKLGLVQQSVTAINPNSGNEIQVWICKIYHDALYKWYKENL